MRLDATAPFALIDDAAGARLYRAPERIVRADRVDDVRPLLASLRAAVRGGSDVAGYLSYEAGAALAPRPLPPRRGDGAPLAWFGVFGRPMVVDDVAALLPDPAGAWVGAAEPLVDRDDHAAAAAHVLALIAAGDLYQANLTFRARVRVLGDPLAIYAALRARAAAPHAALVWTGADWLLSLSPEMFFEARRGALTARPMKGTARREDAPDADRAAAAALAADPKQRAENLMIVDLLRNDLSRVAAPGSVETPSLFAVETYPTVHQMTSQVAARLADGLGAVDVLEAAFPCGSVTGAPKQRAAEVIGEVEPDARGPYTGSIGWIGADGDACFNVAIRTLHLPAGESRATLGLGSGVVADSAPSDEWDECLAKGAFLTAGARPVDLLETMTFEPLAGLARLDRHLARMAASAEAFGRRFDRHAARNVLQLATFRLRAPARVRLVLGPRGGVAVEVSAPPPAPAGPVDVVLAPLPVAAADWRLRHKTSDRAFWERARAASGAWEVVCLDAQGRVTEGSFTSVFVRRGDRLLTPPLRLGLLPGVLRAELIAEGRAEEAELCAADLAGGFLLGNSLRGLFPARLVAAPHDASL